MVTRISSIAEVSARLSVRARFDSTPHPTTDVLTGIEQDSRVVQPGDLYVALPGSRYHGADFAAVAARNGAVAMLSDKASTELPTIVVADPRRAVGPLAAWFHHEPSESLDLYGVTGTNGKTSTVYLIDAGLRGAQVVTGIVTGVEIRGPRSHRTATSTTPEACDLQRVLAEFVDDGVAAAAMEVSSHGLALHRAAGTHFRVGVFTNLDRDHLDFHTDMDDYFAAKASLFQPDRCDSAVVGIDDEFGRRLVSELRIPCVTFSSTDPTVDFYADRIHADEAGTSFRVHCAAGTFALTLQLLGTHQVDNALAAIAALATRGVDIATAIRGIETLGTVPGRLERVDRGQPFLAFVDYAHNVGGQRRLFAYLRTLTSGRVIAVVGATGGRDRGKRGPLGFTAARAADVVIVADESPDADDPVALREDVATGARAAAAAKVVVIADRRAAIAAAVDLAEPGDVVVVAGRGHDAVQRYGKDVRRLDDRAVLAEALSLGAGPPG